MHGKLSQVEDLLQVTLLLCTAGAFRHSTSAMELGGQNLKQGIKLLLKMEFFTIYHCKYTFLSKKLKINFKNGFLIIVFMLQT